VLASVKPRHRGERKKEREKKKPEGIFRHQQVKSKKRLHFTH
jgi:hypothetical protein